MARKRMSNIAPKRNKRIYHENTGGTRNPSDGGTGNNLQWQRQDGTKVKLSKLPGETDRDLLKNPFRFQCPPLESYSKSHSFNHQDYDTIRKGQFSRRAGRSLMTLSFGSLFVEAPFPFVVADEQWDPQRHTAILERICESGTPFLLTMGKFLPHEVELEVGMTLREFTVEERAGEPDTKYVDVSFVEYREANTQRRKRGKGGGKGGGGNWPKTHKLKAGDTLHELAKRYYGRPSLARTIARANNLNGTGSDVILSTLNKWKIGDKVKIPHPPEIEHRNETRGRDSQATDFDAQRERRDDLLEDVDPWG